MPAVIPFIPLIAAGVSAGAGLTAAKMGSNANRRASETEARAAQEALDWEKSQVAAEQARLAPYQQAGAAAVSHMANRLGLQTPPPQAMTFANQSAQGSSLPADRKLTPQESASWNFATTPTRSPQAPATGVPQTPAVGVPQMSFAQPRMVRIRHPRTGEVRAVPSWQAQALLTKGGQVVG